MGLSGPRHFSNFHSILANLFSSYADFWAMPLFWVGKKDSTFGVKVKIERKDSTFFIFLVMSFIA